MTNQKYMYFYIVDYCTMYLEVRAAVLQMLDPAIVKGGSKDCNFGEGQLSYCMRADLERPLDCLPSGDTLPELQQLSLLGGESPCLWSAR